jgi:hypothetical protein
MVTNKWIYISGPPDVLEQRAIVRDTIEELNRQWKRRYHIIPIEHNEYGSDGSEVHFDVDREMRPPSKVDVLIVLAHRLIGTPTPFLNPTSGQPYQGRTEYELVTALSGDPRPHILLFRRRVASSAASSRQSKEMDGLLQLAGEPIHEFANDDELRQQLKDLLEAHIERRLPMLPNPMFADMLEQHFWTSPETRRLFFYSAVYTAACPEKPGGMLQYLAKRLDDVDGELTALQNLFFEPNHRGVLKHDEGILDRVATLVERDFGNPPRDYVTRSENAFHDQPYMRNEFMRDVLHLLQNVLGNCGLQIADKTQTILGTNESDQIFVLSSRTAPQAQPWHCVVTISTSIAGFNAISTAYGALLFLKKIGAIPQQGTQERCAVITPAYDVRAKNAAIEFEGGVSLLDATVIWQLEHLLSDQTTAEKIAAEFNTLLGTRHGLISIDLGLKALGLPSDMGSH